MTDDELRATCELGGNVIELAERWLQVCRRAAGDVASRFDEGFDQAAFVRVRTNAQKVFEGLRAFASDRVLPSNGPDLAKELLQAATTLKSGALAARAFADALELDRHAQMLTVFAPEGTNKRLGAGQAVPIAIRPFKTAFGDDCHLTTPMENQGPATDCLKTLGLLPDNLDGFHIDVQRLPHGTLDALSNSFSVGFGVLHPDFIPLKEYAFDSLDGRFFWVGPRSSERQRNAISDVLRCADREKLQVLVLPELCHANERAIDDSHPVDTWSAVIDWFKNERQHLAVLVGGSRHVERENEGTKERRNELLLLVAGCASTPWTHAKFNPLTLGSGEDELREDIHTRRTITLFLDAAWSFVPLICKDFLLPSAQKLLQTICPGLVLVSSMSDKTAGFRRTAIGFTAQTQTVVVYANTALQIPGRRSASKAMLGFVTRPIVGDSGEDDDDGLQGQMTPQSTGEESGSKWDSAPQIGCATRSQPIEIKVVS